MMQPTWNLKVGPRELDGVPGLQRPLPFVAGNGGTSESCHLHHCHQQESTLNYLAKVALFSETFLEDTTVIPFQDCEPSFWGIHPNSTLQTLMELEKSCLKNVTKSCFNLDSFGRTNAAFVVLFMCMSWSPFSFQVAPETQPRRIFQSSVFSWWSHSSRMAFNKIEPKWLVSSLVSEVQMLVTLYIDSYVNLPA